MSELKVHKAYNRWLDEEMPTPNDDLICNEVYLKSEVDKLIVDLEESHKKEVGQLLMEILELKKERDWLAKDRAQAYDDLEKRAQLNIKQEESNRRHKYKRCLAMAKWCETVKELNRYGDQDYMDFAEKWHKRWLAIAEKFKEAK